uniref:Stalled ribosome sensor GCN1-like N-terminal domain-containing protein n=1 Tax=Oryza nivara TaxID=4536 RepID=A0A0E0G7U8_ORYNI
MAIAEGEAAHGVFAYAAAANSASADDPMTVKMLRDAAADVVSSSTATRIHLFREILSPLLSRGSDSALFVAKLIRFIFRTLPVYDDQASNNAVDDLVQLALRKPTFLGHFAFMLVETMEQNMKFSRPPLLSDVHKMYVEKVRNSMFHVRESPQFFKLILDFAMTSSSLSSEYKQAFLYLYVGAIINPKDQPSQESSRAFVYLLSHIGCDDFEKVVLPSCLSALKENPQGVLQSICYLLKIICLDLSKYCMVFKPDILRLIQHSDEQMRADALVIVGTLIIKSTDPETLTTMLDAITTSLGGSKEELSNTYKRIGMINALAELSTSPAVHQINTVAASISGFLMTCYKDDGKVKVFLSMLDALIQMDLSIVLPAIDRYKAGLKDEVCLRKGYLELLRAVCKNSAALRKITSLLDQLVQLLIISFTSTTQRLDGIYTLFAVSRIVAVDTDASLPTICSAIYDACGQVDLFTLICQNELSSNSALSLSELSDEDCLVAVDLVQSLIVENLSWVKEKIYIQSLLQLLIHPACHPHREVRKLAYVATEKILASTAVLGQDLLLLFNNWLSLIGNRTLTLEQRSTAANLCPTPIPSTGVLIRFLFLIAPYVVGHSPRSYSQLILCSHHPCISNSRPAAVWKRLQRVLKHHQIVFIDLIATNMPAIFMELLRQDDSLTCDEYALEARLHSLRTVAAILPNNGLPEFEARSAEPSEAANAPPTVSVPAGSNATHPVTPVPQPPAPAADQLQDMIPMQKEAFISLLKAISTSAASATATIAIFVVSYPIKWPDEVSVNYQMILEALLFVFFPLALLATGLSHAAEKDERWLGLASALVLFEFFYTLALGGGISIAIQVRPRIAVCATVFSSMVVITFAWSLMFSHPEWFKKESSAPSQESVTEQVMPQPSFRSKFIESLKRSPKPVNLCGINIDKTSSQKKKKTSIIPDDIWIDMMIPDGYRAV